MTLKQLEAFYWAATCGNFALAAERVHLSVSSLSKRIAELERSLGQALFDRAGHRAALTDAGLRLLPQAGALLQQADGLRQTMGQAPGLVGPCRLGVGELTALTWLPALVNALAEAHPALEVGVHVDIGEALSARLDRHELDVAVIAGPARRPSLVSTPLTQATFAWCARPDLAARLGGTVDAAALQAHPLVGLPAGSGITQLVDDWLRRSGAQAPRRLDCNHWGAIAGLLVHRGGIGLLPVAWAATLCGRGLLAPLDSPVPLGALDYALHCRRDDLRPLVQALRELTGRVADFTVSSSVF
ncbi:LysR family transcriptional regulator [Piscinibacter sakaiensis]|uniref:LysR family transcriptional regulator y2377 n=1 Tax=Piscinibacter sakaiensis TaxID=1547922 RepID=A0A0K8P175_PISS1|nr:LysR family transcriptional regulator [Piscinibacter sakaiensis]GAP36289.1 LysR family transcriptional regulator y2377 [Piscinibacter sakaiensis]